MRRLVTLALGAGMGLALLLSSLAVPAVAAPAVAPPVGASERAGGPDRPGVPAVAQRAASSRAPALRRAAAALAGEALADEGDATMAMRDLWLARPDLSPEERRTADALLARPTDPGDTYVSYGSAPTAQACAARVCVTYATAGEHRATPAWTQQTLATVEAAWTREVDELGYRAPAPDGTAGGGPAFDVYLADVSSQGLYGYCAPEAAVPGQPGRAQAYCVLDNDMVGFDMDPTSSLAVTAAHEFFHAVQFNIDAGEDLWFMEASATWIEEQVADNVNDNRQFLEVGQLGKPALPLDRWSSDLAMYGNWIFLQWLAQAHGVDAVRQVWDRLDATVGQPDEWSLQGVRGLLEDRNASWSKFYARFVEANLTPRHSYEEGAAYRPARPLEQVRLSAARPQRRLKERVSHLAAHTVRFRAAPSLTGKRRLRLVVDARTGIAASPGARALVYKKSGKVRRVDIRLSRRGRGAVTVDLRRSRVRKVVLVLSNASLRYRRCGSGTTWSCGGVSRDDDQRFKVRARVVR